MFTSSLMESIEQRITMREISYDCMKSIVEFCYTGTLTVPDEDPLELLSAANMFQFEGIKEFCSTYLKSTLDASNCLNIVSFADLHTCQSLKETAEEYSQNNFLHVVQSEDFLEITVSQLKELLSNDAIAVTSEKDVFEAIVKWIDNDKDNRKEYYSDLLHLVRLARLPAKVLGKCHFPSFSDFTKILCHMKAFLRLVSRVCITLHSHFFEFTSSIF